MKNILKNEKGFVALFTVLLTSVILAMAIGIASISLKEIVLSSAASEGSLAFFAADSGIECALYWEMNTQDELSPNLNCNGRSPEPTPSQPVFGPVSSTDPTSPETYYFSIPFGENGNLCADIVVKRGVTEVAGVSTLIESKGSNTPCDDRTNNPKRVERAIRVTY